MLRYEAVGRFYEAAVKRQRTDKSFSVFEEEEAQEEKSEKEEKLKELTKSEKQYLLTLDAAEWKVKYTLIILKNLYIFSYFYMLLK